MYLIFSVKILAIPKLFVFIIRKMIFSFTFKELYLFIILYVNWWINSVFYVKQKCSQTVCGTHFIPWWPTKYSIFQFSVNANTKNRFCGHQNWYLKKIENGHLCSAPFRRTLNITSFFTPHSPLERPRMYLIYKYLSKMKPLRTHFIFIFDISHS